MDMDMAFIVHAGTDTFPRCCANVTAYDALNVALAEALDAPLVTCDARLTRACGVRAAVRWLGG
jgi:hypothetical protein